MSRPSGNGTPSRPLDPAHLPLEGLTLIEASAGTGKTYTITTLYLRLLLERDLGIDQILVVTFTRAATVELRDRIRARVREALRLLDRAEAEGALPHIEDADFARILYARLDAGHGAADRARLNKALRGIDEAAILTIHGFCQRVLQDHAFECGLPYNAELLEDESGLRREVAYDFWASRAYSAPAFLVRHLRTNALGPDDLVDWAKNLNHLGIAQLEPPRATDEGPDLEAALRRWRSAYDPVVEGWRSDGPAVIEDLASAAEGSLHKGIYKKATIRQDWAPAMELALSIAEPGILTRFDKFKNFGCELIAEKTNKNGVSPQHPFFDACQRLLEAEADFSEHLDALSLDYRHDFLEYFEREMDSRKRRWNKLSFGDQLRLLHAALYEEEGRGEDLVRAIRETLKAALVDEFQDTDRLQYEIFRRIFVDSEAAEAVSEKRNPTPLLLIGDPKQAIYGFRGADIFAYLEAVRAAGERRYTLARNWRSDPGLIDTVNQLFDPERVGAPFVFDEIGYAAVQPREGALDRLLDLEGRRVPPMEILQLAVGEDGIPTSNSGKGSSANKGDVEGRLPRLLAGAIAESLGAGHRIADEGCEPRAVEPGDIAVLVRTNDQGRAVQAALRERGLPCVLHSEVSVLDSEDARVARRILTALIDPSDVGALRVALASDWLGWTANDLVSSREDAGRWLDALEDFQTWRLLWRQRGIMPTLRRLLQSRDVPARILARPDGERRLTDILHLAELLHTAERRWKLGPEPLLRWLGRVIEDASARSDIEREAAEMRLERDEASIQIVTVHKSKGLEYPIVYCPYLWADVRGLAKKPGPFTYHRADGLAGSAGSGESRLVLNIGGVAGPETQEAYDREALAEDLRLLYVAVTRARHRCVIVWGRIAPGASSALGYLLHPSANMDGPDLDPGSNPDPWQASQERVKERFKAGEEALREALEALCSASGGTIHVKRLDPATLSGSRAGAPVTAGRGAESEGQLLGARSFTGWIERDWSLSSFSRIKALAGDVDSAQTVDAAQEGRADESPTLDPGRDHDERVPHPEAAEDRFASEDPQSGEADAGQVPLVDFPAGPEPGTFLHEIFEVADFQGVEATKGRDPLPKVIQQRLPRHGFDPEEWSDILSMALTDVLATPLTPDGSLRLCDLSPMQRLDEMEFALPISPEGGRAITPARLADALMMGREDANEPDGHGTSSRVVEEASGQSSLSSAQAKTYAERIARMGFRDLRGFLRGFIDLVFEQGGRWYIVDYKSNHLGSTWADYRPERLRDEMVHHDYLLQYHLYLVALDRYLRSRIQDYDPDRHLGGVFYLFLRGMTPDRGHTRGVFYDRPPARTLAALRELFASERRGDPDVESAP